MTAPPPASGRLRWMVRLEHARLTRFGERPRTGLLWGVTPYIGRTGDGRLIGGFGITFFASRAAAIAYARRQMRATYGRTTR